MNKKKFQRLRENETGRQTEIETQKERNTFGGRDRGHAS